MKVILCNLSLKAASFGLHTLQPNDSFIQASQNLTNLFSVVTHCSAWDVWLLQHLQINPMIISALINSLGIWWKKNS